jgi:hypothetical protein
MVMSDAHGDLTTRLNAAYEPLKDNRLLPLGFTKTNLVYDTVAIWGDALNDVDYDSGSAGGVDNIIYRLPLNGAKGLADLQISLLYQTLPPRWMNDLFQHDSINLVAQFKSMYTGYQHHKEIVDEIHVDDINLSVSAIKDISLSNSIILYPNPNSGNEVWLSFSLSGLKSTKLRFELVDHTGKIIQSGQVKNKIELTGSLKPGIYFFAFYDPEGLIAVRSFVRM